MGNQFAVPGKQNAVAGSPQHDLTTTPGKGTLVEREHPTQDHGGNAGIDAGGGGGTGPGYFLNDKQRLILIVEMQGRALAVQQAYVTALTELRMERYVKQQSDFGAFGDLVIAMILGNAANGVANALKRLLKIGEATRYIKLTRMTNVKAEGQVQTVSSRQLDSTMRSLISPAQAALRATLAPQQGEKQQTLSFTEWMRDNSIVAFQHLREDNLDKMTDADLLVLFASLEGSMHTITHYKQLLQIEIDQYLASHVSKIGREQDHGVTRETRVAWLKLGANSAVHLAYVSREFGMAAVVMPQKDMSKADHDAYHKAPMLGYNEGKFGVTALTKVDGVIGLVEPKYIDMALEKHGETWKQCPETFVLDFSHGVPQVMKE